MNLNKTIRGVVEDPEHGWKHPFEDETVRRASEKVTPRMDIHDALTVVDQEMDWLRREVKQFVRSDRDEYQKIKETDDIAIYTISGQKWEHVVDELKGPMHGDFRGRIGNAVSNVHYWHADYKTGGLDSHEGAPLVLSKESTDD